MMELLDVMHTTKIDLAYLKDTNEEKKRSTEERYKLLYLGAAEIRNVMELVIGRDLKDKIVNVRKMEKNNL